MANVFISYSHHDKLFTLQLVGALSQQKYTIWSDKNDGILAEKFREDIKAKIEGASAFIFILSPDFMVSEACGKELAYALDCGKKLIPILHRSTNPSHAPRTLRELDWQALRELDWIAEASFDRMLENVLVALLIDKDDWKQAGRWLRMSKEWERDRKQHSGLLLHGKELKKGEDWLKRAERWRLEGSGKQPQPQASHIKFIRESRHAANRTFIARIIATFLFLSLTAGGAFRLLYHDPTRVTIPNDDGQGSLRWCIANAPAGSTITFDGSVRGIIKLTSADLTISKNLVIQGPGARVLALSSGSANVGMHMFPKTSVTISDLSFKDSSLKDKSFITNEGTLQLTRVIVSGNSTQHNAYRNTSYGGGITNRGTLVVSNSLISGNSSQGYYDNGGSINSIGTLVVSNSTFSGNSAQGRSTHGGAIESGGTLTVSNSTFSGNSADSGGGGIRSTDTLTISNSIFSDNSAGYGGGGIESGGTLTVSNSTFSGNSAGRGSGGGISSEGTLMLSNSTLSGNSAGNQAGGIDAEGKIDITFCTIYNNTASQGGELVIYDSFAKPKSQTTIRNSLIAANHANSAPDISGSFISGGYNLVQDSSDATFTPDTGDQLVPDLSHVFASSARLGDNGGPTQTLALLSDPGNPALNVIPLASCQIKEIYDEHSRTYIDQRGEIRPGKKKTACDIGAYEVQM